MCLAWYGSQSEAAGNRCLWLRTILRQPVFPLWVVGSYFLYSVFVFTLQNWFVVVVVSPLLFFVFGLINIPWTLTTLHVGLIHPIPHQKRKTIVTGAPWCSQRTASFCPPLGTLTSIQNLGGSWFSPSSIDLHSNYDNFQRTSFNLSELLQHELSCCSPNQRINESKDQQI